MHCNILDYLGARLAGICAEGSDRCDFILEPKEVVRLVRSSGRGVGSTQL
jgi:hypothetical protein